MKSKSVKAICIALISALLIASFSGCGAKEVSLEDKINNLGTYIEGTATELESNSIGGEWVVVGMVKSGYESGEGYIDTYKKNLKDKLKETKGVLSERKTTDFARVAVALATLGENPWNFEGYDIMTPLDNYNNVVFQGMNGPIWAVLASELSGKDLKNKDKYIDYILDNQLKDGGWALSGNSSDIDITAMAVYALCSTNMQNKLIKASVDSAIDYLANAQAEDGTYTSYDVKSLESVCQVVIALSEAGIDVTEDERFIKDGKTLLDVIATYENEDGSYSHIQGEEGNEMATEQALLAFAAAKSFAENGKGIF